ncbi:hypothetical protein LTR08_001797 [Meristemomyces frigidus]|nr:hypothetical protein LTR08_001797 [Meristemomyces frigidus]
MASHGIPRVSATATALGRSEPAKEKERTQIAQYQALEHGVVDRIKAQDYSAATLHATSALLARNPEYYTIWNYRRLVLQDAIATELAPQTGDGTATQQDEDAAAKASLTLPQQEISLLLTEDLHFLIPLLKQYPKCYWIWNHRAWLLATATTHLPTAKAVELWQGEMALVTKMLALDSRNFHGWGYRRTAVGALEELRGSMVEPEFAYTTKMIGANLSNFSAWHNRSQLIPRLLSERLAGHEERKAMLDSELELITRALYTDPYDQSLWFYHQYLMSTLDPSNKQTVAILQPCTTEDRVRYLEQETESVKEMLDGAEDCKYIYQALLEYSGMHLEINDVEAVSTMEERKGWLGELRKIDPLREGRWRDLERKMGL